MIILFWYELDHHVTGAIGFDGVADDLTVKAAPGIHPLNQHWRGWRENRALDVGSRAAIEHNPVMILHGHVDQQAGIVTRVGSIQADIGTTAEAHLTVRHFENDIMPFEVSGDMHPIAETVDPAAEQCDPRGAETHLPIRRHSWSCHLG